MGKNLTRKILEAHLAKPSDMKPGEEIYVKGRPDPDTRHQCGDDLSGI